CHTSGSIPPDGNCYRPDSAAPAAGIAAVARDAPPASSLSPGSRPQFFPERAAVSLLPASPEHSAHSTAYRSPPESAAPPAAVLECCEPAKPNRPARQPALLPPES